MPLSRLGLTVVFIGSKILTLDEARELYWPLQDEPWFREFMTYLISGEVRAYWTTGEDAMSRTLNVKEQTRARFARDRQRNAIHAPKTENDFSHNILLLKRVLA